MSTITRSPNTRYDLILNSHLPEIPARVLWLDDGTTGCSVLAPAHWPAAEILDECIALCDYDTPENATYHVTFTVSDCEWHAESESWDVHYSLADKTVAYHPDEPSCAPDCNHKWDESGPYGEGAGTRYTAGCIHCEWKRDTYHYCYNHGADQFNTGVVYEQVV